MDTAIEFCSLQLCERIVLSIEGSRLDYCYIWSIKQRWLDLGLIYFFLFFFVGFRLLLTIRPDEYFKEQTILPSKEQRWVRGCCIGVNSLSFLMKVCSIL